jgi:pilus assembly protein Flp/PilA
MSSAFLGKKVKGVLTMTNMIRFLKDEDGATAIEYGLIAALISVAAITAMGALGSALTNLFNNVATNLR